jgi:hypothetical protein
MSIGLFARTRTGFLRIAATAFACAALTIQSQAQPRQALYTSPAGPANDGAAPMYSDAYGNPLVMPASYCQPCGGDCGCYGGGYGGCNSCGCNGGCYGPGCAGGGFNGCMPMGAGGTDPPIGYDLMNDVGVEGAAFDQRGPHYFDIRAEAVYYKRDKTFNQSIDFTSQNVGNTIVLSSEELEFDWEPGFRIIGRYDICPLAVIEFGYMGIYSWETSAVANDPTNNLFSLWSRPAPGAGLFGVDPVGVNLPGGPNPESERASQHRISLDSDLQTAEISYRRYWLGHSTRISGTWLAGFRYTRLDDEFQFRTQGSEPATNAPLGPLAALRYDEDCENNLAGFQAGGDIWLSLCQGLRVGSEAKAGIYNNHYSVTNRITTTPLGTTPPTLFEELEDDKVAFIGEASVDLVADVLPSVSLRVGYEVLFMDSLVIAGENFNQTSPYGNQGTRVPFVNDDGEAFYHGAHAGIEWIW